MSDAHEIVETIDIDSKGTKEVEFIKDVDIVVARYNESLEWMNEYPFSLFHYTIYNKGPNENFLKKEGNHVISIPNVGRCDHTFLYHIVNNYSTSNLKQITIFLPGCIDMPNKKTKAKNMLERILQSNKAYFPAEKCSSLYNMFKYFQLSHWKSSYNKNHSLYKSTYVSPAKLRPYGKWYKYHFGNKHVSFYCINSIFSLDKRDIEKYPLIRYEYFCRLLATHPHPEACHYMERSWGALFGPFLHTKVYYL